MQFAKTLGISHSEIDKKVCETKSYQDAGTNYGKYGDKTVGSSSSHRVSVCGGRGVTGTSFGNAEVLNDFVRETLKEDGNGNWPTSKGTSGITPESKTNDNAKAVADDLTKKLTTEEKTIVAGLLAKTIEGGEVVEIRAVSSTSVMVNACYDLLSEGLGVVPYACVGLGGNFVGVVDEYSTIRPS
ncbi:Major surface antigen 4 precursor [Anaplasma phagocytophilum]|uniref:Major surface antigen 4 n=1 Tax=Anaplasma phagocytophilum TaxID=948 RepID=A0AA45UTF8_ANAPH|nr:Major surface antigen 4 precursor [Anaplasma phagocytophilum]SBO33742.1 Major surface antigen 4 precursor [Anaplasma phagocytophilum]SBO33825.1 Major surface antigen 4 precursor [Anaplasma phagocytophilum]